MERCVSLNVSVRDSLQQDDYRAGILGAEHEVAVYETPAKCLWLCLCVKAKQKVRSDRAKLAKSDLGGAAM